MINLSDCQKKKLLNNLKKNKSVFLRLNANQVNPKRIIPNPYISINKTKKGYSLFIDSNDYPEVKKGGFLQLLIPALEGLAGLAGIGELATGVTSAVKNIMDANENKRHNKRMEDITEKQISGKGFKYECCNKCNGKGLMKVS